MALPRAVQGTQVRNLVRESVSSLHIGAARRMPCGGRGAQAFWKSLPQAVRNHTVRALSRSPALPTVVFRFVFPPLFFPFLAQITCFSIIESAHIDPALAFKHAVLTEPCKQALPPQLAVWGTLENLLERWGGGFPKFNSALNTEFLQLAPGHRSSGSSSCWRSDCGAGRGAAWQHGDGRRGACWQGS